MSGHSKWSTIKHQKGVTDKRRGQAFSRLVKLISIAAREGGPDPSSNFKLRLAIDRAKSLNMPKDNIKRAIDRVSGSGVASEYKEIKYEAFGPYGVAFMVECITDNSNRTLSAVKSYFEKRGFSLGSPGSASYLFVKKGQLQLALKGGDPEEEELKLIDYGPDDIIRTNNSYILLCPYDQLAELQSKVEEGGFRVTEASLVYWPQNPVKLPDDKSGSLQQFVEGLMDIEDVENVYSNVV